MYVYQKINKSGNSLAVTIPAKLVKTLGLRSGGIVRAEVDRAKCQVTYTFISPGQLPLIPKKTE